MSFLRSSNVDFRGSSTPVLPARSNSDEGGSRDAVVFDSRVAVFSTTAPDDDLIIERNAGKARSQGMAEATRFQNLETLVQDDSPRLGNIAAKVQTFELQNCDLQAGNENYVAMLAQDRDIYLLNVTFGCWLLTSDAHMQYMNLQQLLKMTDVQASVRRLRRLIFSLWQQGCELCKVDSILSQIDSEPQRQQTLIGECGFLDLGHSYRSSGSLSTAFFLWQQACIMAWCQPRGGPPQTMGLMVPLPSAASVRSSRRKHADFVRGIVQNVWRSNAETIILLVYKLWIYARNLTRFDTESEHVETSSQMSLNPAKRRTSRTFNILRKIREPGPSRVAIIVFRSWAHVCEINRLDLWAAFPARTARGSETGLLRQKVADACCKFSWPPIILSGCYFAWRRACEKSKTEVKVEHMEMKLAYMCNRSKRIASLAVDRFRKHAEPTILLLRICISWAHLCVARKFELKLSTSHTSDPGLQSDMPFAKVEDHICRRGKAQTTEEYLQCDMPSVSVEEMTSWIRADAYWHVNLPPNFGMAVFLSWKHMCSRNASESVVSSVSRGVDRVSEASSSTRLVEMEGMATSTKMRTVLDVRKLCEICFKHQRPHACLVFAYFSWRCACDASKLEANTQTLQRALAIAWEDLAAARLAEQAAEAAGEKLWELNGLTSVLLKVLFAWRFQACRVREREHEDAIVDGHGTSSLQQLETGELARSNTALKWLHRRDCGNSTWQRLLGNLWTPVDAVSILAMVCISWSRVCILGKLANAEARVSSQTVWTLIEKSQGELVTLQRKVMAWIQSSQARHETWNVLAVAYLAWLCIHNVSSLQVQAFYVNSLQGKLVACEERQANSILKLYSLHSRSEASHFLEGSFLVWKRAFTVSKLQGQLAASQEKMMVWIGKSHVWSEKTILSIVSYFAWVQVHAVSKLQRSVSLSEREIEALQAASAHERFLEQTLRRVSDTVSKASIHYNIMLIFYMSWNRAYKARKSQIQLQLAQEHLDDFGAELSKARTAEWTARQFSEMIWQRSGPPSLMIVVFVSWLRAFFVARFEYLLYVSGRTSEESAGGLRLDNLVELTENIARALRLVLPLLPSSYAHSGISERRKRLQTLGKLIGPPNALAILFLLWSHAHRLTKKNAQQHKFKQRSINTILRLARADPASHLVFGYWYRIAMNAQAIRTIIWRFSARGPDIHIMFRSWRRVAMHVWVWETIVTKFSVVHLDIRTVFSSWRRLAASNTAIESFILRLSIDHLGIHIVFWSWHKAATNARAIEEIMKPWFDELENKNKSLQDEVCQGEVALCLERQNSEHLRMEASQLRKVVRQVLDTIRTHDAEEASTSVVEDVSWRNVVQSITSSAEYVTPRPDEGSCPDDTKSTRSLERLCAASWNHDPQLHTCDSPIPHLELIIGLPAGHHEINTF